MEGRELLVEIINLKKYFPVPRHKLMEKKKFIRAVDGVSFSIYKGETLGLVGESGCGKSTVAQIIVRLLDSNEGKIAFKNRDITRVKGKELQKLRKEMQIVFQDPQASLNPRKSIGWILEEPLCIHHIGTKDKRKVKVKEMLVKVGLNESFLGRFPHELSGGQKQRIDIAAALILTPTLVIADEPVSALDVSVQAQILNLLKDLQEEFKLTYIFVSHDLNVVHHISDRVAVMYLGGIVELADVNEIYETPLHPYTKALLSAIPSIEEKKERKRITLMGDVPSPVNPPPGCTFHTRCPRAVERCKTEKPEFREVSEGHFVSCHFV